MPQLNPAPWFMTLITAWTIIAILMMLTLTNLHHTAPPYIAEKQTNTPHWPWTWQ
uniref:ATP synthase complex subunit 8 n=1 Tax=Cyrtodactylus louisiadensis TaxID=942152 RepID=A0A7R7G1P0_9SAUR|nr:ATP synthase F0 subunit 8 [Cyrtodactylus louisiadensis]